MGQFTIESLAEVSLSPGDIDVGYDEKVSISKNKAEDLLGTVVKNDRLLKMINRQSSPSSGESIHFPELSPPRNDGEEISELSRVSTQRLTTDLLKQADINLLQSISEHHRGNFVSTVNRLVPNDHNINGEQYDINKSSGVLLMPAAKMLPVDNIETPVSHFTDDKSNFKNLFGDLRMFSVGNLVVSMTNFQRVLFNQMSATSIKHMVAAAIRSGSHIISAAQQNFSGALTSGIVGSGIQAGSSYSMFRASKKECHSIDKNLKAANFKDAAVKDNQVKMQLNSDKLRSQGKPSDPEAEAMMARSHSKLQTEAMTHRDAHYKKQSLTQQCRVLTDSINQVNQMGQHTINAGFAVNAATETGQAELSKAVQHIQQELSDIHKQKTKGAEDIQSAINQSIESWRSNNTNTVSSIAGR